VIPRANITASAPGAYQVSCRPKRDIGEMVYHPLTINVAGAATTIWDNHNDAEVSNGGTPPTFDLDVPVTMAYLETYHYNGGSGTGQTGEITVQAADGTVYGPYATEGLPGQGDVPNAYWVARPGVELPAGSYTVTDSDPATWSQNAGTQGRGMVRMMGALKE
jgi:hypothetical protein